MHQFFSSTVILHENVTPFDAKYSFSISDNKSNTYVVHICHNNITHINVACSACIGQLFLRVFTQSIKINNFVFFILCCWIHCKTVSFLLFDCILVVLFILSFIFTFISQIIKGRNLHSNKHSTLRFVIILAFLFAMYPFLWTLGFRTIPHNVTCDLDRAVFTNHQQVGHGGHVVTDKDFAVI